MANILVTIKNVVLGDKEVKGFTENLKKLEDGINSAKDAAGQVAEVFKQAWDLSKEGAQLNDLTASFERMNAEVFKTPTLLDDMVSATNNTIAKADAMKGILTLSAGATDSAAQAYAKAAPRLLEIAKASNKLNPALGDTAFMFDSLALGIKRGSPMILDNLGLQIKLGEANENYARQLGKSVEQLTAEEKTMALLNATMAAGDQLITQVGGNVDAQADAWAQLEARQKDYTNTLKQAFAERLLGPIGGAADTMDALTDSTEKGRSGFFNFAVGLREVEKTFGVSNKRMDDWIEGQRESTNATYEATQAAAVYDRNLMNIGATSERTISFSNALGDSYAAAAQAAVDASQDTIAAIEATKAHQAAVTEAFKGSESAISNLINAESEGVEAIAAAEEAIRDEFRQTAAEAILARGGINQANLDLLVSIGYLTEQEAEARLSFAETQVAIEELTASQEFQRMTTEQQSAALNSLIEGQNATAEAALRTGENMRMEGESVEHLRQRLVEMAGTYTASVSADTSAANAALDRLQARLNSIKSGGGVVTSDIGSQLAADAAAAGAGNALGGLVTPGRMGAVGEGNRPELLSTNSGLYMIPGDRGRVFSNSESQQMVSGGSGGVNINGPLIGSVTMNAGEDVNAFANRITSMVSNKLGGLN